MVCRRRRHFRPGVDILATLRWRPDAVAPAVGLFITAAYWFTASTSFANPAVTIARTFTDSFSGIAPAYAPAFIAAQCIGAAAAAGFMAWLIRPLADGVSIKMHGKTKP